MPHPLGPVSSMNSPGLMERLISSIAGFEAFGYEYVKFLTSTIVDTDPSHNIIVSSNAFYSHLLGVECSCFAWFYGVYMYVSRGVK